LSIKKLFSVIAIIAMSLGSVAPAAYAEENAETIEARLVRQYSLGQSSVAIKILGKPTIVENTYSAIELCHQNQSYTYRNPAKLYLLHQALIIYY